MNGFNKTEAAVFLCRLCFLRAFPFISLLCREKYNKHKRKVAAQPHQYISLIVDNMDQAKTRLRRCSVQSKVSYIIFINPINLLRENDNHVSGWCSCSKSRYTWQAWRSMMHPMASSSWPHGRMLWPLDANVTTNANTHALHKYSQVWNKKCVYTV